MAVRPHPFIEFADDNTFVDKNWGKAVVPATGATPRRAGLPKPTSRSPTIRSCST